MEKDKSEILNEVSDALECGAGPKIARFILAGLSAVPFVGGVIGGTASAWSEKEQERFNTLLASWLKLQEEEIKEIGRTIVEVMARVNMADERVRLRMESQEYLSIVKKCFRDWSAAESEYKRILIRNLLANASSTEVCSDDIIRLFIEWIDRYSEQHFKVVGAIYNNSGITRREIWDKVDGEDVRENSAKADLFRLIIDELSQGRVIRQHREVDYEGNFVKTTRRRSSNGSSTLTSAFDDEKEYELTELGQWLIHYTMNEIVPKIDQGSSN